jgi:hypothetical protein
MVRGSQAEFAVFFRDSNEARVAHHPRNAL